MPDTSSMDIKGKRLNQSMRLTDYEGYRQLDLYFIPFELPSPIKVMNNGLVMFPQPLYETVKLPVYEDVIPPISTDANGLPVYNTDGYNIIGTITSTFPSPYLQRYIEDNTSRLGAGFKAFVKAGIFKRVPDHPNVWMMRVPDSMIISDIVVRQKNTMEVELSVTLQAVGYILDDNLEPINFPIMNPANVGTMRCNFTGGYYGEGMLRTFVYQGILESMKPNFPTYGIPSVTLNFTTISYDLTRAVKSITYPSRPTVTTLKPGDKYNEILQAFSISNRPDLQRSGDWYITKDPKKKITLKDILVGILAEYDIPLYIDPYPGEDQDKNPLNMTFDLLHPLYQTSMSDFQFIKQLGQMNGFNVILDPVDQGNGKYTNQAVLRWVIGKKNDKSKYYYSDNIAFYCNNNLGSPILDKFNIIAAEGKKGYSTVVNGNFIMLDEPNLEISASGTLMARAQIFFDNVTGQPQLIFPEMSKNGSGIVIYQLDWSKIYNPGTGDTTAMWKEYYKNSLEGKITWKDTVKFFRIVTDPFPAMVGSRSPRAIGLGWELSFTTLGNPWTEIIMFYPIYGLGDYYTFIPQETTPTSLQGAAIMWRLDEAVHTFSMDNNYKTSYQFSRWAI